ncbi:MAG: tryptophan-rich sensory protein [Caldilineaceae bacterium]|nr:tryptophan-rich sensory protein [Caldilineaceae bacterium]
MSTYIEPATNQDATNTVMHDRLRQILVLVAIVATIVVNGLANALPINGQQTGDISDRFDVFFVPAGYVFSIWGVIYLALIGYGIFQAMPAQRENPRLRTIGYLFVLSCVANIVWIFLWHYELFPLTLAAMLVLLGSLIAIYLRLGTGVTTAGRGETWFVRLTFSIYLGWITVATIANVTSLLDYLGWGGFGLAPALWAVIMLVVGAVVGLFFSLRLGDIAYVLVLVWAFVGIAVKHSGTPLVAWTAAGLAGLLALSIIGAVIRRRQIGATATPLPAA